jgi:hypothetical protein
MVIVNASPRVSRRQAIAVSMSLMNAGQAADPFLRAGYLVAQCVPVAVVGALGALQA